MPWKTSSVMEEKLLFVFEYERDEWTMSELCQRFEIGRETVPRRRGKPLRRGAGDDCSPTRHGAIMKSP
ncbi:MAG: hypothetical protein L0387_26135, partial [Acidobacteria bacterium]|nr:hypothetical protein [Acidobacteriota bacterium]